jgi:hypothetical protein
MSNGKAGPTGTFQSRMTMRGNHPSKCTTTEECERERTTPQGTIGGHLEGNGAEKVPRLEAHQRNAGPTGGQRVATGREAGTLAALDGGDGDDAHMHRGTHLHSTVHTTRPYILCVCLSRIMALLMASRLDGHRLTTVYTTCTTTAAMCPNSPASTRLWKVYWKVISDRCVQLRCSTINKNGVYLFTGIVQNTCNRDRVREKECHRWRRHEAGTDASRHVSRPGRIRCVAQTNFHRKSA